MPLMHPDASAIISRLQKEGVSALYHFTSFKNLGGISRRQALCSKKVLCELGDWPVPEPGGNTLSHFLDGRGGNLSMMNLNFTPHTPMAYNAKSVSHLCFIEVPIDVASWQGVIFTDTNAVKSDVNKGEGQNGLDLVDFGMIHSRPQPWNKNWHRLSQAEVLVPEKVPIEYLSKVIFVSEASRKEGERLWGSNSRPAFEIGTAPFASYPEFPDEVGFSYVSSVLMTDSLDNLAPKTIFRKRRGGKVISVVHFKALAGTEITVRFDSVGQTQSAQVPTADAYKWEPYVMMDNLELGSCCCEVMLGNILWSQTMFEMV